MDIRNWNDLSEKEQLLCYYSDAHKDAYGFRPKNWDYVDSLSVDELKEKLDVLYAIIEESIIAEEKEQQLNIQEFEEKVIRMINDIPGSSREGVIKFLIGEACDVEMLEYQNGLPYNYLKEFRNAS